MSSNTSSSYAQEVRSASKLIGALVAALEPGEVTLPDAVGLFDAFVELQRRAEAGAVLMAARAVEAGDWQQTSCTSPADWLSLRQGTSVGRAGAGLATSKRLGSLPTTARNVRSGAVSVEQAGVVASAAEVNPRCERDLLAIARTDSLKHLKEAAARRTAEAESELEKTERERKIHAERSVRYGTSKHRWWLHLSGPIPTGAAAQQQLEHRIGELMRQRNAAGDDREGREQVAYDAVIEQLTGTALVTGTDADRADGSDGKPTRVRRARARRLMLVRVDLAALIRGEVGDGEVCEIPGVGPVSVSEARRMFGDSVLSLVTTDGPAVVDVVNLSRKPTVGQQIAKLWTDPKCVVAGCNRTIRIEYEHRVDWAGSKQTVHVDSEHMCSHDHARKTHQNYQLVAGTGRRALVPPGHPLHPDSLRAVASDPPLEDTG